MLRNEGHLQAAVEAVRLAALGVGCWETALAAVSDACGANSINLVGVDQGRFQFAWAPNIDPAMWTDLGETLHSERTNPRLELGARMGVFELVDGLDFVSTEMLRRFPAYGEICRTYDVGYGAQINLEKTATGLTGVAVLRGWAQGHGTDQDRKALLTLAPHLLDAVRLERMIETRRMVFASDALEAAGTAAFLCDGSGRVRSMTLRAQALVGPGGPLALKDGELRGVSEDATRRLRAAISVAAGDPLAPHRTIGLGGRRRNAVEIAPLPRVESSLGFAPRVIVTVRSRREPPPAEALINLFDLTAAEAEVAHAVSNGVSRAAIAAVRGVSVETIRAQLKSVYAKLGVSREAEMIARINQAW